MSEHNKVVRQLSAAIFTRVDIRLYPKAKNCEIKFKRGCLWLRLLGVVMDSSLLVFDSNGE